MVYNHLRFISTDSTITHLFQTEEMGWQSPRQSQHEIWSQQVICKGTNLLLLKPKHHIQKKTKGLCTDCIETSRILGDTFQIFHWCRWVSAWRVQSRKKWHPCPFPSTWRKKKRELRTGKGSGCVTTNVSQRQNWLGNHVGWIFSDSKSHKLVLNSISSDSTAQWPNRAGIEQVCRATISECQLQCTQIANEPNRFSHSVTAARNWLLRCLWRRRDVVLELQWFHEQRDLWSL